MTYDNEKNVENDPQSFIYQEWQDMSQEYLEPEGYYQNDEIQDEENFTIETSETTEQ